MELPRQDRALSVNVGGVGQYQEYQEPSHAFIRPMGVRTKTFWCESLAGGTGTAVSNKHTPPTPCGVRLTMVPFVPSTSDQRAVARGWSRSHIRRSPRSGRMGGKAGARTASMGLVIGRRVLFAPDVCAALEAGFEVSGRGLISDVRIRSAPRPQIRKGEGAHAEV